jgi:hypothetical protein
MAVNTAFHTSGAAATTTEKNLYADLVAEAIQIYGHDVHYKDTTLVAEDTIFGEDNLSKFVTQAKIEMYVENADGGYAGQKELMSQFGLENLSEITFVVSKNRFQDLTKQFTIESGTDTLSGSIELESGTIPAFESGYMIAESTPTDADRPQEGDLIYHPTLSKIFQINFVDHDDPFHQLDNNPVYKMSCRLFDYSSQVIDTDIAAIDAIETDHSLDTGEHQTTLEQSAFVNENLRLEIGISTNGDQGLLLEETDGDNLIGENDSNSIGVNVVLEDGYSYLLQETYAVGDGTIEKTAQNEIFDAADDTVLDFTESNPFGDAGGT